MYTIIVYGFWFSFAFSSGFVLNDVYITRICYKLEYTDIYEENFCKREHYIVYVCVKNCIDRYTLYIARRAE